MNMFLTIAALIAAVFVPHAEPLERNREPFQVVATDSGRETSTLSATEKTWRLRDPIHDLIVFHSKDRSDSKAWELINTKDFQRLRRVKQLGVSEFVFPGATHTRFSHSIGVYNNARRLLEVLDREGQTVSEERKHVVLMAALLHDVGHGPFSHAFEKAREVVAVSRKEEGKIKKHEKWSASLILAEDGQLWNILGADVAEQVAAMIEAEDPVDVGHSVVSSSFDADRLDYVLRDRYMTGAGAGSIDQEWLIDNLTTYDIFLPQDDDRGASVPTFVFRPKGRQAAEDFLLARYRLYSQIYLHKTTRGFEQVIAALFRHIADETTSVEKLGLDKDHPLLRFLRSKESEISDSDVQTKLGCYRRLDDNLAWAMIEQLTHCKDEYAKSLATRLHERQRLRVIDVTAKFVHHDNLEAQTNAEARLDKRFQEELGKTVFVDRAPLNLYSRIGSEAAKEHKKVRVLNGEAKAVEITDFPDTIVSKRLMEKRDLVRYYFIDEADHTSAEKLINSGG
jgi:uncharacterized protein